MPQSPTYDQRATIQRMIDAGESEENIATVIKHFQSQPTKDKESTLLGETAWDFGAGVLSQINPLEIAKSLYGAVRHPVDTASALLSSQVDQGRQAIDLAKQGRYSEMVGHGMAAALPILGPAAANIGEEIGSGQVARGLGAATGLLGTVLAPTIAKGAASATRASGAGNVIADAAQAGAERRIVDVMAPKVGANKVRFGNMAASVAGKVAGEPGLGAMSRSGLAAKVSDKLSEAEAGLDAASDARNAGHAFPTGPIIKSLQEAKAKLTAEAVKGSHATPAMTGSSPSGLVKMPEAVPIGKDVIPAPSQIRVAQIDKAISEVRALGPMARYESLRKIRQSWDGPAKAKYSPSMTADYLAKQGEAAGAADVTSALRDHLAQIDPAGAKANQAYALWRKASDVLQAAEETERVRPTVGRKIAARFAGAVAGGELAGGGGAALGVFLGPIIDGVVSSGVTPKVVTARMLSDLAKALRSGDATQAIDRIRTLRALSLASKRPKEDSQ